MNKIYIPFFLLLLFVLNSCSAKTNKTVDVKYADYGFVCPNIVLQSGITFGLTNKFPTLKDFVNENFLNENYSLASVKKEKNEYFISYDVSSDGKVVATYTIGCLIDESEKTFTFNHIQCTIDGNDEINMKCPKTEMTDSGMRKLGEFYGFINEMIQHIFNMKKMNEAIN